MYAFEGKTMPGMGNARDVARSAGAPDGTASLSPGGAHPGTSRHCDALSCEAPRIRECASRISSSNDELDSPVPDNSCERAVLITCRSDAPGMYGIAK